MEQLQITRNINQQVCQFFLTEVELEAAYRLMQRRYLDEDFANTLCNEAQNPDCRFHTGHLEEFPELTTWLCEYFDHFFDANMAHNDLLELTINHLQHASLTPAFFTELARLAPAFCEGTENPLHTARKTAYGITAAAISPRQMTAVSVGNCLRPFLPCTNTVPAAALQRTLLPVRLPGIYPENGTSTISFPV